MLAGRLKNAIDSVVSMNSGVSRVGNVTSLLNVGLSTCPVTTQFSC